MKAQLTRGQQWVYELLNSTSTEITAQDLYTQLQAQGRSLGLATVYRAIKALQLQGLVQARALTNGEWVYRLASEGDRCRWRSVRPTGWNKSWRKSSISRCFITPWSFSACAQPAAKRRV